MRVPLLVTLLAPAALLGALRAGGQAPAPKGGLTPLYYGVSVCADCHRDPKRLGDDPLLCRCNEVQIWEEHDKHREAAKVLSAERSRDMGRLLGIADVARDARCVACHGVVIPDDRQRHKSFRPEEGVSCVACHGAFAEWVDAHGSRLKRDEWRGLSRADKERDFGMTDLWDPVKRTKLCASCHVGNREEGKFVTHAMYAAGHPPLPSFEVAAFSDAMPRHWQYLAEKPPAVQKLLGHDPARRERAELVAAGGVVIFRESMRSLAAGAAAGPLDYAHFDCAACHHDLRSPGWRQARGYAGAPGRPRPPEGPAALLPDELRAELSDLNRAFDVRPFGDPARVADAAGRLARRSAEFLEKRPARIDEAGARRLLRDLARLGGVPDYDAARQRAWAVRVIDAELRHGAEGKSRLEPVLTALNRELRLSLPAGQRRDVLGELPEALKARADYDPAVFRERMAELAAALGE